LISGDFILHSPSSFLESDIDIVIRILEKWRFRYWVGYFVWNTAGLGPKVGGGHSSEEYPSRCLGPYRIISL
jgi:hypothetical protein